MEPDRSDSRGTLLFAAGLLLWLAALVSSWPVAASFEDEVGYLGEARLLLEGHVRPLPESPGIWTTTEKGRVSKFPLLVSLLVAPLFAVTPRLVFASGVAGAVGLAYVVSRVLRAWGRSPAWALVILAHPTIVIMARTVMADLLLATFALAAWWAMRRNRSAISALFLILVVATKATGFTIAFALVAGEVVRARQELMRLDRDTCVRLAWALGGILGGAAVTASLNFLTTGTLWFAYDDAHRFIGTPVFWPRYFWTSAPVHISSLLVLPPALVVGVWPFWCRREIGPLFVIFGLISLMCFYFFVDHGRTTFETLLFSPRLILPAVAFLLVGYADVLAGLVSHFPRAPQVLAPLGLLLVATCCFEISRRHGAWQEPSSKALSVVSLVVAETRAQELGLTAASVKAGILAPMHVVMSGVESREPPEVVLCNTQTYSYRATVGGFSCLRTGYQERERSGSFRVLVRRSR